MSGSHSRPRSAGTLCRFALLAAFLVPAAASARSVTPRAALTPEERVVIDMFEKAKRSVVYISTSERVRDFWTRNVRSIPQGTGSGFFWDGQGDIVTNYHVISGASEARVRLNDGRDYPATLVGASPFHDIAVLRIKVPSNRPPPLPLGTSHDLRVGQSVYAIGNPFGLDWTLTTGIVSALDRALDNDDGTTIEHLIQTDAAINPGNSGGPLLDSAGRLIGMNTAIYSPSGASAGIGFAVPIDIVNRVAPALIARGRYAPPSLGIEIDQDLNDLLSERLNVEGVFVLKLVPNGPAAAAGLRAARVERGNVLVPGDVIVSVGGKPVSTVSKLQARLDDFNPGDRVSLGVLRGEKRMTLEATLAAGR
ncbi:MAG TPA: trypsin-like peptidase domain-containing protein [Burkholderiales bacterium]|nr:trypsin-like peptidase domain-containing protein [Burkholderiales bacterium]